MSLIRWDLQGDVLALSLNRAAKKNAVNLEMIEELDKHLDQVVAADSIRVVIVRGQGGCFCAGADLKALAGFSGEAMRAFHDRREQVLAKLEGLPCPTISAIEGFALGTGLELALSTDIRLAGKKAFVGIPSSTLGIVESHLYIARLVRCAGLSRARFLVLTGERLSAADAKEWGLVERVYPDGELMDQAHRLAEVIAANAPASVRLSKRILQECDRDPYLKEVADPGAAMVQSAGGPEMQEGTTAFAQKRPARFSSPSSGKVS